jgi:hypothetical protein
MKVLGRMSGIRRFQWVALAAAFVTASCYDFHLTGPEDPEPLNPPHLVSVTIEYRQPFACANSAGRCNDPVVFFASWMEQGNEFRLTKDPAGFIWRGRANGVPVNFPPRDDPHAVRVYDPHLLDEPTQGGTADRLSIGGQRLTIFDSPGEPKVVGLVYVDDYGVGHNPF